MRGTLGETLDRFILLQIGAAAATRQQVERIVEDLIRQGRMEREEGRTMVEDVMSRARERSTGARAFVDTSVQQGLRATGVPNREAYEDLLFRVEQLEHRVRLLEGMPTATREAAEAESTVTVVPPAPLEAEGVSGAPLGEPEPPMPPVGGSDPAPGQTPPGVTPGLPPRP
jgi:polyhydroxyalkanoate synthesis regulator phasin